jgi:hypothetical protein
MSVHRNEENGCNPHQVLIWLAENEIAVAKLYRTYARRFPKLNQFWSDMAAEEANHAKLIKNITENFAGEVDIRNDIFDAKIFAISADFIALKNL